MLGAHETNFYPIIDQQLKSQFKFFDLCDRIFSYIKIEEGEDDNVNTEDSIYY